MDKRAIGASVALATALTIGLLSGGGGSGDEVAGSYRGGYYAASGSYRGGSAATDTFKLLVKHDTNPNPDALSGGFIFQDSHYDSVLATVGGMKYGYFLQGNPNASQAIGQEIRVTGIPEYGGVSSGDYYGFVWFDISSLPAGKVERAKVVLDAYRWGSITLTAGQYFCLRVDTIPSDYTAVQSASITSDPHECNASYNYADVAGTTAWAPALSARDDRNDYGVRSNGLVETTLAGGTTFELDVTDAVQAVIDKGLASSGLLCWYVSSGTGGGSNVVRLEGGNEPEYHNPTFEAVVSTPYRGVQPWGHRGQVPFVFIADDGDTSHMSMLAVLEANGGKMSQATAGNNFGKSNSMSQADWDNLESNPIVELLNHGSQHESLGSFTTDGQRNNVLRRDWIDAEFTATIDTTRFSDFVYAVGAGTPVYDLDAIGSIVDNNYRMVRAATDLYQAEVGAPTFLGWDNYVNTKLIAIRFSSNFFGADGSEYTDAQVVDSLNDEIDYAYTWNGKAPVITFVHDSFLSASSPNGVSASQLKKLSETIAAQPNVRWATFGEVAAQRLAGSPYIAPSDSFAPTGYDSMYSGLGDSRFGRVWIGPK